MITENNLSSLFLQIILSLIGSSIGILLPAGFILSPLSSVSGFILIAGLLVLPHMNARLSQAETAHPDELDEEFDTFPTSRPTDVVRMRLKSKI
ncbi:hypothetical protein BC332_30105 [Capsicum chinense]|nr:hypothetical protein BC332_30105 [Capsicum chinense]